MTTKHVLTERTRGAVGEISHVAGEALAEVERITGLSSLELVAVVVALVLFGVFFGGSGKGRGRRYRRGFGVAYREELGKQRAKMRAEHDRAERERKGWDMDIPHRKDS